VTLGWLILAEPVTIRTLLAGAIIVTAVALIVTARFRPAAPVRP
jgi:drug/metabolite transporter (DMT)-like permease